MAKLTLSIDGEVVKKAHAYAGQRGASVSSIVENYFVAVTSKQSAPRKATPVLDSLSGVMKGVELADYRQYLTEKYR